ncbi:uncharacterized protein LOC130808398 [Amaranthus tricolor]|uniref:uncharacterized protein LOC130808398 n=1 Tax=Amaranthus tricolor TaxID=29722 RepID=UPI00258BEC7B|nr:uncharacterized protein LOC130808398 [Amaranthus tricolor]
MVVVENEEEEIVIEEEAPDEGEKSMSLERTECEEALREEEERFLETVLRREDDSLSDLMWNAKCAQTFLRWDLEAARNGVETLKGECSTILECKVPKKEADPRSFTIPVKFGEVLVNKALVDLGASLADRSVRFPVGVVEDMPVQIGKFYVPCDFVIMDIVEDDVIPIILGRDFLMTARAIFDVFDAKLTFNILGEDVEFHLPSIMKGPADESLCRAEVARVEIMHPQYDDPLRSILEGVKDGRRSEAASLKKLLDEPDFYMEPMMETVLEASVTAK